MEIFWGIHPTLLGKVLVAVTGRGLCGLDFVRDGGSGTFPASRWPSARLVHRPATTAPFAAELERRLRGASGRPLTLRLSGTPFQLKVWEALLRIPSGSVAAYGDVARAIGRPLAVRAVGTAVGSNPVSVLIPCHRVIRSTGAFGEYHWGAWRKRALLGLEGARAR